MLKARKCINNQQYNSPWSPALHDTIRIVSIWKSILSQFKTIDDPEIMEQVIADRNFHHLNQAQGTPLTIEPLLSLIGTDNYTSFS